MHEKLLKGTLCELDLLYQSSIVLRKSLDEAIELELIEQSDLTLDLELLKSCFKPIESLLTKQGFYEKCHSYVEFCSQVSQVKHKFNTVSFEGFELNTHQRDVLDEVFYGIAEVESMMYDVDTSIKRFTLMYDHKF